MSKNSETTLIVCRL